MPAFESVLEAGSKADFNGKGEDDLWASETLEVLRRAAAAAGAEQTQVILDRFETSLTALLERGAAKAQ